MATRAESWGGEARALIALAVPLIAGNLAWAAIGTTDLLFLGRIGPDAVAAGALALAVYTVLFMFGMGITAAAAPLVASARGRRLHAVRDIRRTMRAAFHTVAIVSLPTWLLLWFAAPILRALGQAPDLARDAARLMHGLQWALLPWLAFVAMRNFIAALERPLWGVAMLAGGIGVNALAGWCLIFGHLGAPALGLLGAGLASTLSATLMAAGLATVLLTSRRFRRYHLFGRWWRADGARLGELWRIGLPIAVTQVLETGVFNAAGLLMGLIGRTALAAHAVAIQIAILSFMVPMGLSQAATVRVGLAAGRRDPVAIGRAGWSAIALGGGYALLAAAALVGAPRLFLSLFLDLELPANAEVVRLGTAYLGVCALFQLFDSTQVITAGALRGLRDTRVPMLIAGFGYWVIGIGAGGLLAFRWGLAGVGIWAGLASGLGTVAVLLVTRWARRGRLGLAA